MKYKKKIAALNTKMAAVTDENNQHKLKAAEKNNQRSYRLDLEKSQKMVKKLEERLKKMETTKATTGTEIEIQKHIATSMYKEDRKRKEREAELEAEKSKGSRDLNNLIVNDEEDDVSNSQQDEEIDGKSMGSKVSVKHHSHHDQDEFEESPQDEQKKAKEIAVVMGGGVDYVQATLHAWSQCPTIVKK